MTNTINNVPRELKPCPFCSGEADPKGWMSSDGAQGPACDSCGATANTDEWNARAPSPAGVDGLEVVAWLCEWMGDKCGGVYSGLSKTSLEGLRRSQGEDVLIVSDEPLCHLSGAQAIIDGLRGEVERSKQFAAGHVLTNERISESLHAVEDERDQQAQRIGELEGLLRHAQKQVPTGSGLHMRIDAALSAGKEGE